MKRLSTTILVSQFHLWGLFDLVFCAAVSHADLPTQGNLTEGLKTRTWAVAIDQETIQRYQIAEHYSYADLTAGWYDNQSQKIVLSTK